MWMVFGMFLTPLPPNVDQFTLMTWIIFPNFQPPLPLVVHMVYGWSHTRIFVRNIRTSMRASFSQVKRQPWYFTDRVGYCIFSDIDGELSRLLRPLNQLILVGINCDQGWAQWEEIIYFCYVRKNEWRHMAIELTKNGTFDVWYVLGKNRY